MMPWTARLDAAMKVKRLNHAVLRVSDVPRAQEFWTSALGMVEAG